MESVPPDHRPLLDDMRQRLINIENKVNELLNGRRNDKPSLPNFATELVSLPNPQLQKYARKILSLVRPRDVVGKTLVRKGRDFDGGYVMLNDRLENATVYSLGISDDVSWDLDMAKLGCEVFQYDHTIERFPLDHPKFHSFKIGICERPSDNPVMKTIDELIEINNHRDENDIILKMDIEGGEWKVFEAMAESTLTRFSQIILELHWITVLDDTNHLRRLITALEKLNKTHQLIHLHANNYGRVAFVGGTLLPDSLEVAYVRKEDHTFSECKKIFPTELDMPCNHNAADVYLGPMGQV